jgi:hypothetical protein
LDYYSHTYLGLTAAEWGKEQADNCWALLKSDPGECPLSLDEENSPNHGYKVTIYNSYEYNVISRAFLERWDYLTGTFSADIYCSPGWLPNLFSWHKNRDLWLAWYNRTINKTHLLEKLALNSWKGNVLFWQFASDGVIDNDGKGDGLSFGFEYATLDLNIWLGTVEEWSKYCGKTSPVVETSPPSEDDIDIPVVIPNQKTKTVNLMDVDCPSGLNIRNVPIGETGTKVIGWKENKKEVEILETKNVGSSVWARVGQDQWMAIKYNGITYLK